MNRPRTLRLAAVAAVLVLGACNTPAGGGGSSQVAGGGGGGGSSQAAGGGGGGGTGADAPTLNPCSMLSASDIQAATGWSVDSGKLETSTGQSQCMWANPADDTVSVGVAIANYDDNLWQAGKSAGNAKPVTGLGDDAYAGWPTGGTLNVKVKTYAVTLAIIDFKKSNDQLQAEDATLAKVLLPKL